MIVSVAGGVCRLSGKDSMGEHGEAFRVKYEGKDVYFTIPYKLFVDVATKFGECEIAGNCLRVDGGKYILMTALQIKG